MKTSIAKKLALTLALVCLCISLTACSGNSSGASTSDYYYSPTVTLTVTEAYDMEIVLPASTEYVLELVDNSHYTLTRTTQIRLMNGIEIDWGYLSRNMTVFEGTYTVDSESGSTKSLTLAPATRIVMSNASGQDMFVGCDSANFPSVGFDYKENEQATVVQYTSAEDFLSDFAVSFSVEIDTEVHTLTVNE